MKEVYPQLEILRVSVSIGLAFEHLYLVVDPFHFCRRDWMVEVVEQTDVMSCELIGEPR
jgi:hypothetical protein